MSLISPPETFNLNVLINDFIFLFGITWVEPIGLFVNGLVRCP